MSHDFVAKSGLKRMRALFRKKLKYPNDAELRQIADLAKVDDPSLFGQHVCSIILDAHQNNLSMRGISAPKIANKLRSIVTQTQRLGETLKSIDVGSGGSPQRAGLVIDVELSKLPSRLLLPQYIDLVENMNKAAKRGLIAIAPDRKAETGRRRGEDTNLRGKAYEPLRRSKRGPKGAGGNHAFDLFVEALLIAARQRRGAFSNYKSADGSWTGTLLKALELLRPYLPARFFPTGVLGRSVDHIRTKLKHRGTKNRTSLT